MKVGIVGATGLVGQEMLKVLEDRRLPVSELHLWASERSLGEKLSFQGTEYSVKALEPSSFENTPLDFVLFATSAGISAEYAPKAAGAGAMVIDNSSHFRLQENIPLVVPEVNPDAIFKARETGIIANPNCSTIQLVACLKPLNNHIPIKRVVVSTYQSVSGAGSEAMEELQSQVGQMFSGQEIEPKAFPHQIAFNCIPHIDVFLENGMSKEEMKMIWESRKILDLPRLKITATAVRVPTFVSHCESVNVDFESEFSPEEARQVLQAAPGIIVADEPNAKLYPTPFVVSGNDEIFVGRIRRDESVDFGLHFWIVADNLRKGAATNAVQIAELCLQRGLSRRN